MTIYEAITVLSRIERILAPTMAASETEAILLGIEALKEIKKIRQGEDWVKISLLSGETE